MAINKIKLAAIRALEDAEGRVAARQLVDAARDPAHPLHDDFPWNDAVAADERRLDIARRIIASCRIVYLKDATKVPYTSVAYVRDPQAKPRQGYRDIAQVATDRPASMEVLTSEVKRVQAAMERCREIATALGLLDELEDLIGAVDKFELRLRRGDATISPPPVQ